MLAAIYGSSAGAITYGTGTALIRYLYVISSFKDNIEKVMKRDHFVVKSILIGDSLNFLNAGSLYLQMGTSEFGRSPMMVYQACMNPWNDHTIHVTKLHQWNHLILVILVTANFACNLFLYRFLENMTGNNSARSEVDKKRDRRRNLVPAHIGMISIGMYLSFIVLFIFTYSFKTDILDNGTRAFLNAAYGDFMHCVLGPFVIISGSMDAQRKVKEIFTKTILTFRSVF
jgi:hypothetical protein